MTSVCSPRNWHSKTFICCVTSYSKNSSFFSDCVPGNSFSYFHDAQSSLNVMLANKSKFFQSEIKGVMKRRWAMQKRLYQKFDVLHMICTRCNPCAVLIDSLLSCILPDFPCGEWTPLFARGNVQIWYCDILPL